MKLFTLNMLIVGILFILAGFGSMYISTVTSNMPSSSVQWMLIMIACWSIGIAILVGDIFYNRRGARTLVYDKKYWILGIFFILIALNILNMVLNNTYEKNTPEYEYWNDPYLAISAVIPAGFAFCAFYIIKKKRQSRKMGNQTQ